MLFRDLAERIQEVFYVMDPNVPRMLYVSPSYERVWGRSCRSLYDNPTSYLEAIAPEFRGEQVAAVERQMRGEVTRTEYVLERPDGSRAWIWDSAFPVLADDGTTLRIVGLAADVTEHKKDQERLRIREQQLALAVRAARAGFWEADIPAGEVRYDRAWRHMLGIADDAPEPDWMIFRERLHPDDAERVSQTMFDFLGSAADRFELEFRLRHTDGRWLSILSRGLVVDRDASGFATRTVGTHQDISEHRELEAARSHRDRLESIGSLTGGVAHNFNNLLAVIMGTLEQVLAGADIDAAVRRRLTTALRATESGAQLTRSLLALASDGAPEAERMDLVAKLVELSPVLSASLPSGIGFSLELPPEPADVLVDVGQFDSAVVNLVVNAGDAIDGEGAIRVRVHPLEFGGHAPVSTSRGLPPGTYFVVEVRDDGRGMDEETCRRAFDPYFTTKGPTGGTGLGLSTVSAFCDHAGGTVTIDSRPGRGTTVEMILPAAGSQEQAPTSPGSARPASASTSRRVLVVEDNEPLRMLCIKALEEAGYAVHATASVGDALAELAAGSFDVVFSDVMFDDGRSGLEVARWVESHRPHIPVVLCSGVPLSPPAVSCRFLPKPYRVAELLAAVAEALAPPRG